jgi:hypothetical protein
VISRNDSPPSQGSPSACSPFELLDQLLDLGHISKQEHVEQCKHVAAEMLRQRRTQQRRADIAKLFSPSFIPTPNPSTEQTMNTKDLLDTMQLNKRIMSEQLKTLNSMNRQPVQHQVRQGDPAENTADLLNQLANAHLGTAAQTLHALAGATARARDAWHAEELGRSTDGAPVNHEVIDVEVVELQSRSDARETTKKQE